MHFVAVRVFTQGSTVSAISILAPKVVGLQQVVEPSRVDLAAGFHRFVQAILVKFGFVQPTLEVFLAENSTDLGTVHGTTLVIAVRLKAVLTAMSKSTADPL